MSRGAGRADESGVVPRASLPSDLAAPRKRPLTGVQVAAVKRAAVGSYPPASMLGFADVSRGFCLIPPRPFPSP